MPFYYFNHNYELDLGLFIELALWLRYFFTKPKSSTLKERLTRQATEQSGGE